MSKNKIEFSDLWTKLEELNETIREMEGQTYDDNLTISPDLVDQICDGIYSEIESEGTSLITDYDIGCSSNQVEIDDITFDEDQIRDIVKKVLTETLSVKKDSKTAKNKIKRK